ncbi:GNAT family N-acetyltransferase [Aliiruegeria sabulilitoris]|uniref:GNAT family N-acetyltransferase n=1 Tax=Aliiruegeria sabulilitoris TaxID=1510458 RepID=UPI0009EB3A6A|nr:GNAT family N-acetyltransferase [Aliiruegeria sabulilitoris]NDR59387.1 GNAT family N-acetyltransferase [Pseudoruegeria sp. M32A2M]
MIERLETDRLILRRPTPEDAAAYIAYYASNWRATHGPVMQADGARRRYQRILGHWEKNGYGRFVVELKGQPGAIGLVGPHWPDSYPEPELTGQLWTRDAVGNGYGLESVAAARAHAYSALGWTSAVTYIHAENSHAVRMARKLGARIDPTVHAPASLDGHDAWRHPSPEELSGTVVPSPARRKIAKPRKPAAPTLKTRRLTLRPYRIEDFEPYAAFLASDRARHIHGPHSIETAWQWFTNDIAHWSLFGYGGLMIEHKRRLIGQVAITSGYRFPEPVLGWFLFDGNEGKGFATEAAFALRNFAYESAGLETLVSYSAPENARSIAVSIRLGAVRDPQAHPPAMGDNFVAFRHPAPDSDGNVEAYA